MKRARTRQDKYRHTPICPYCGKVAELVGNAVIYGRTVGHGQAWACGNFPKCDAYVGCHHGTNIPLGSLANKALRKARGAAHRALDPLWTRKMKVDGCARFKARSAAYRWIAKQLEIGFDFCHIAMFNEAQCRRVVKICAPYQKGKTP